MLNKTVCDICGLAAQSPFQAQNQHAWDAIGCPKLIIMMTIDALSDKSDRIDRKSLFSGPKHRWWKPSHLIEWPVFSVRLSRDQCVCDHRCLQIICLMSPRCHHQLSSRHWSSLRLRWRTLRTLSLFSSLSRHWWECSKTSLRLKNVDNGCHWPSLRSPPLQVRSPSDLHQNVGLSPVILTRWLPWPNSGSWNSAEVSVDQ